MHLRAKHIAGRLIDKLIAPAIPKRHRLWLQFMRYTKLSGWEPEALHIKEFAPRGAKALDVGANMGLWSYAMSKSGKFDEIIAFEPNQMLTDNLQHADLRGYRC